MDLSDVHFIQAIKDGSVVKVPIIDSRERPTIRFKSVKAIYKSEEVRNVRSKTLLQQQAALNTDSAFSCNRAKMASTHMGGFTVKRELQTREVNEDIGQSNKRVRDDDSFADMTLKELRSRCRRKRKKFSKSNDLPDDNLNSSAFLDKSNSRYSYANVQPKEDDSDLEVLLCSLKTKLPKRSKAKRKFSEKIAFSSSDSAGTLEAFVENMYNPGQDSLEIVNVQPISIKIEILEADDYLVYVGDSTSTLYTEMDFDRELSRRVDEELKGWRSTSLTEDNPICGPREVSYDYVKLTEPVSDDEIVETNTELCCLPITLHESFTSHACEPIQEDDIANVSPICSTSESIIMAEKPDSEIYMSGKDLSCPEEVLYLMDIDNVNQMSKLSIGDCLECLEPNDSGDSEMKGDGQNEEAIPNLEENVQINPESLTSSQVFTNKEATLNVEVSVEANSESSYISSHSQDSSNKDVVPHLEVNEVINSESLSISSHDSSPCFNPHAGSSFSVEHGSPTNQKCSSSGNGESTSSPVGSVNCLSGSPPDATNRPQVVEIHSPQPEYPSKKLFSTRKAISPSSQEKLRHAMDVGELYDHIKRSRLGLEGAKIIISPKRVLKKRQNRSSHVVPKGILKAPNSPCAIPRDSAECATIQYCTEKAIAFSLRQMRDIECLASKLVRDLNSMKDIVEENFLTEAHSSAQLKATIDKMRLATDNAAQAEETTRKWLSMMGRDCNRFCKIMTSIDKKAAEAASVYEVNKAKKKKITFADEAGGVLCHVKVFKDHSDPLPGSQSEKLTTSL